MNKHRSGKHNLKIVISLYEAVEDIESFIDFSTKHKNDTQRLIEDLVHNDIVAVYLKVLLQALAKCAKKLWFRSPQRKAIERSYRVNERNGPTNSQI